jgi:two-component system chemotaxis sensor kinase CheA
MGGQELVKIRDELLPVIRLHKLYNVVPDHEDLDKGILINILSGSKKVCLFADELIRHHQTVIKGLPEYIGLSAGISGCNILDDGTVGLIIDVSGLINIMEKRE